MRCLAWMLLLPLAALSAPDRRPTLLVILADDLGTGDVTALSMSCRIRTPYLDGFSVESTRLTDYHTSASVCSPTRYGILTGRHAWRTCLQAGVPDGDSPSLIAPG